MVFYLKMQKKLYYHYKNKIFFNPLLIYNHLLRKIFCKNFFHEFNSTNIFNEFINKIVQNEFQEKRLNILILLRIDLIKMPLY